MHHSNEGKQSSGEIITQDDQPPHGIIDDSAASSYEGYMHGLICVV